MNLNREISEAIALVRGGRVERAGRPGVFVVWREPTERRPRMRFFNGHGRAEA